MKIAQIAPLWEKVPPEKYGGTERVVSFLTEELVKRGHDVTLFAAGTSQTSARLFPLHPVSLREADLDSFDVNSARLMGIGTPYMYQKEFDIIHDHNSPFSLPTANLSQTPVIATLHGPVETGNQKLLETMTNPYLISISKAQLRKKSKMNHLMTIYHGINMEHYPFSQYTGGYLLFVGRIAPVKGLHHAIAVAEKLNLPLIIAAKLDKKYSDYFEKDIKPHLSNKIRWIGEVSESERNQLMAHALAFLHPACWEEPFGLTLIEALACGSPVIAFNRGSIPEIIKDSQTGYIVEDASQMCEAVKNIKNIERIACRRYALDKFNVQKMTNEYEAVYKAIIEKKYTRDKTQAFQSINSNILLNN